MDDTWKLTVWGARGSFPSPGPAFLGYGVATACLSVELGGALVVLDAGSGLTALGADMLRRGIHRADILLSHIHLDHVMGLFTSPLFNDPAAVLHLYGRPGDLQELRRLAGPPLWPVGLTDRRAQVYLHEVLPGGPFSLAGGTAPDLTITALEGSHPGGCLYYRLEGTGHCLVYALDCELTEDVSARLTEFSRGADLLVWDASFLPGELIEGWGHSTWEQGLALGRAAGAKRVLMSHYGPGHTDGSLREQEALAAQASPLSLFAKEGMEIEL